MNTNTAETNSDVVIIGASMAGSCLARHLKLKHPELSITVIDKKKAFDYGIGESMLEVFWEYASNELMLGPYLDSNFLAKNGLRFFFDTPEKDLKLSDMSEMGRAWIDSIPAHQINRKQFDEDMCRMNRELGIEVMLGCGVDEIELDAEGGHRVLTSDGKAIRCKWLVDAAGFNAPVARKLDLVKPLKHYQVSSRWGRFRNINALDHLGPVEWRERVNFNSRFLSTNHFMYKGYWIWLIPLEQDLFSIGVVWRHDLVDLEIKTAGDYVEFLRSHRGVAELLGEKFEVVDYHGLKNMSRMSDQMYSADRWFLTGMSAAFLDPLFSGGSAFMSESNRMIVDLIETDMAGDRQAMKNKATCYNAHSRWWLENFLLHIKGNYHGSFDLMRHLFEPLLMDYFGLILPFAMARNWGYDPAVDYGDGSELRRMKTAMVEQGATMRVHHLIDEFADFLAEHEGVFHNNEGKFFDVKITKNYIRHSLSRGRSLTPEAIDELQIEMLELTAGAALRRMAMSVGREFTDELLATAVASIVYDGTGLTEAFDRYSNIDETRVMPMKPDRRMADAARRLPN